MAEPTTKTTTRIAEVAALRVNGSSWDTIAKQYGYKNRDTAFRTLTRMHKDLWRAEYETARALYLDEIEAEASLTLRQLLRSDDDRIKQQAAASLLAHCAKLRAQKIELTGADGGPVVKVYAGVDDTRV